jgi:hypothetical protein
MKLEVGMYVRTNQGIAKYLGISKETRFDEEYDIYLFDECIFDNWNTIDIDKIDNYKFKVSNNIIDLIEVGDYVNGVEVIDKEFDNFNEEYLQCGVGDYVICTYEVKDIKSIVTKEMFESMQYKVD